MRRSGKYENKEWDDKDIERTERRVEGGRGGMRVEEREGRTCTQLIDQYIDYLTYLRPTLLPSLHASPLPTFIPHIPPSQLPYIYFPSLPPPLHFPLPSTNFYISTYRPVPISLPLLTSFSLSLHLTYIYPSFPPSLPHFISLLNLSLPSTFTTSPIIKLQHHLQFLSPPPSLFFLSLTPSFNSISLLLQSHITITCSTHSTLISVPMNELVFSLLN